ncbi:MAG: Tol-Pal system beta propeller repeat protein TolB [Gammaproteobacteria bacterium]|nr:Tol-Pal system beta propeller repeat protein TolB [Gammaproteobacteria bacterium]
MRQVWIFLTFIGWLWSSSAQAILTIEITEGVDGALPIAVLPFSWQGKGAAPEDIAAIIAADLQRSGRFAPLDIKQADEQATSKAAVDFKLWRGRGIDHLLVGKVLPAKQGKYTVQFQLFDAIKGEQLAGYSMSAEDKHLRQLAHRVSDIVFESLLGVPGAFDTKIAYVTATEKNRQRSYQLAVADADGVNEQIILSSKQPLMSPSWSPDGQRLAYVSFENKRPQIFVQTISSGKREMVASNAGLNNAPTWSPDGTRLAMTLSQDGNAEIYVLNLANKRQHRITRHYAIDTEASWAPDGKSLVFTSDRGGRPQLYQIKLDSQGRRQASPKRLSFQGNYNSRAVYSADGERLAFVHGKDGRFTIAVMDLKRGSMLVVADTRLGESPSFAPNGMMVIYAAEKDGKGVLEAVSVEGRARQRLGLQTGDVREPAWSPYLSKR